MAGLEQSTKYCTAAFHLETPWVPVPACVSCQHTRIAAAAATATTQTALTVVGRMLRLHSQSFGFAGTKDRRGVTTQYITLFKVDPAKLSALNPRCEHVSLFGLLQRMW